MKAKPLNKDFGSIGSKKKEDFVLTFLICQSFFAKNSDWLNAKCIHILPKQKIRKSSKQRPKDQLLSCKKPGV